MSEVGCLLDFDICVNVCNLLWKEEQLSILFDESCRGSMSSLQSCQSGFSSLSIGTSQSSHSGLGSCPSRWSLAPFNVCRVASSSSLLMSLHGLHVICLTLCMWLMDVAIFLTNWCLALSGMTPKYFCFFYMIE